MRLQAGQDQGRKLHVVVDSQSPEAGKIPFTQGQNPLVCVLSPPERKHADEEVQVLLQEQMAAPNLITYTGPSMNSTLREGDLLEVVAAQRGQRRRAIPGGQSGLFAMHINRLQRAFLHRGTRLLSGVYHSLAQKGRFQGFLPKKFKLQVVSFQTNRYQELYKLMVNGKEVGRYDNRTDEWRILRPFRLFVDENELPQPKIHKPPM